MYEEQIHERWAHKHSVRRANFKHAQACLTLHSLDSLLAVKELPHLPSKPPANRAFGAVLMDYKCLAGVVHKQGLPLPAVGSIVLPRRLVAQNIVVSAGVRSASSLSEVLCVIISYQLY